DLGLDCSAPPAGSGLNVGDKERALRHKVIAFYINKAPELTFLPTGTGAGSFFPNPGINDTVRTSGRVVDFVLNADDRDPFNYPPPSPGGPSSSKVLRWT